VRKKGKTELYLKNEGALEDYLLDKSFEQVQARDPHQHVEVVAVRIDVVPATAMKPEQKKRDRSAAGARYALLVSIETPGVETDIWTPIAHQIGVPIEIVV
jgi:hypothetical protein